MILPRDDERDVKREQTGIYGLLSGHAEAQEKDSVAKATLFK